MEETDDGGQAAAPGGGATIWSSPVLVVQQKAKLVELSNEYGVFDEEGNRLATVRQTGQSPLRTLVRLVSSLDQFLTHRLEVVDGAGRAQMQLTRPGKFLKSKILVADAEGREVGRIVQENLIGKKRLALEADGAQHGRIRAENLRSWDFAIEDQAGREVARIQKRWEGLVKAAFTTADNYVVRMHEPLRDPLRTLVVASALAVDTALKQDATGLN